MATKDTQDAKHILRTVHGMPNTCFTMFHRYGSIMVKSIGLSTWTSSILGSLRSLCIEHAFLDEHLLTIPPGIWMIFNKNHLDPKMLRAFGGQILMF